MKSVRLAAVAVLGAGLTAASSFAATPIPRPSEEIIGSGHFPDLVQAASTKSEQARERKKRKRYNEGVSYRELGIIPGHVPTPYGYRDCIGSWHLHADGIIHCHGQLIRD